MQEMSGISSPFMFSYYRRGVWLKTGSNLSSTHVHQILDPRTCPAGIVYSWRGEHRSPNGKVPAQTRKPRKTQAFEHTWVDK